MYPINISKLTDLKFTKISCGKTHVLSLTSFLIKNYQAFIKIKINYTHGVKQSEEKFVTLYNIIQN